MLDVQVDDKHQFVVMLDPTGPDYHTVYMIIKSLLNSHESEENVWTMPFEDLVIFRKKLDDAGLTSQRTISEDAYQWFSYIEGLDNRNQEIKDGKFNEQVRDLLRGKLKSTPYEDQYSAIAYAYHNKRCGIFDDLGSGKTLLSLAAASIIEGVKKVLVICPYTILPNFNKEIKKHTHLNSVLIPRGKEKALQFVKYSLPKGWNVLLVHPENLVSTGSTTPYNELTTELIKMPWDLLIIDEFHMYKNMSAKRTKCILSLVMDARDGWGKHPRVIVLTGTPVSESPSNAYVVLKILNYGKMPHISRFENHFLIKQMIDYGHKGSHMKVVGYKNLDELKYRLNRVSIRRTKDEMKGFPEKVFVTREVELEGRQLEIYKAICGEIVASLPRESMVNLQGFLTTSSTMLRLRQIMNHPLLLGEEGNSVKYEELDNILEEVLADPEAKVVVWTEFRDAVDLLHQRYNEMYGAAKVYGGISNEALGKIQEEFEGSGRPRIAIAIPAKAGTGVDFLARARTAIYVDRPYSLVLFKQSVDRIHRRINVENPTELDRIRAKPATIMFLDIVGSPDELVREKLASKWDVSEAVTTSDEKLIEMGRSDLLKYLL